MEGKNVMPEIKIEINIQDKRFLNMAKDADLNLLKYIDNILNAACDVIDIKKDKKVSILLADDKYIQDLNREYRGKDKPTNVLSFPASYNKLEQFLGDIAVSYDTMEKEAVNDNKILINHFTHLLIHGFLHLCGFDHETSDKDAELMEGLEIKALDKLKIKNPYA